MNRTKGMEFIRKVVGFSVPTWIGFVINLISAGIITRRLLPSDYGIVSTFNAAATLVMSLACLGLDSGFMRYFYEPPEGFDKQRLFFFVVSISLLMIMFLSIVAFVIAPISISLFLFNINSYLLITLLFGNVIAMVLVRYITIYYRMEGNALLYGVLSILTQLAMKGALIYAVLVNPSYEFAILASVIATSVITIAFCVYFRRSLFPRIKAFTMMNLQSIKRLFIYSLYTWPIPILLYFNILATQIIIRKQLGNDAVGIFTSVNIFVGVINVLQAGFSTYWAGYMFANYKTQKSLILKIHDYMSIFIVVLMVFFVLFRNVMFLLIGPKYQSSKPFFVLLLIYPLFLILSETTGYGISIAKKTFLTFFASLISIALNLLITLWLVPSKGLIGACVGSVVSTFVLFALQSYYGQKYYQSIEQYGRTIFTVIVSLVLAIGNYIFTNSFFILFGICAMILLFVGLVYKKQIFQIKQYFHDIIMEMI